ncbi:MAG: PadR family transcriptional regulator [Candidatus Acidiferrum sp.]
MTTRRKDLPQRTMDMLVLRSVALEWNYGWALSQRLHEASGNTFFIQQGSLYPCLRRLEIRGWIKGEWVAGKGKSRAKYYEATKEGRKQIGEERDSWAKLAADVAEIQKTA